MTSEVLSSLGIDAGYLILLLFLIQVVLFVLLISVNMKYNRLKRSLFSFMRGKDGKTLEESFQDKFKLLDELLEKTEASEEKIRQIQKSLKQTYQKKGLIRYDAFEGVRGNLSFVLTMLDDQNNGWIINSMHAGERCYTYLKEVVKGESYIELTEEEKECLERAIFQEAYEIKDVNLDLNK